MDAALTGSLAYEDYEGDTLTLTLSGGKIYAERTEHDYALAALERRVVDFGSVASATIVIVHQCDNAVDLYVNGSLTPIPLLAGGLQLFFLSALTALEIQARPATRVSVVLLGD